MRRIATRLLLPSCFIVFIPNALGQTCTPAGLYHSGPIADDFNFISNPAPNDDTCWAHDERAFFVTGVTSCTTYGSTVTNNAFAFNYAGWISQDIAIPASDTRKYFALSYLLDFDDPNNDSYWNRFSADVYDATTGVYLYRSGNYNGSMPDLFCARRSSPTMYFPNTLAGHTIRIYFHGTTGYSD